MPKDIPRHIPIPIPAMLFNEFMKTTLQSIAAIIPMVTPIIILLLFMVFILLKSRLRFHFFKKFNNCYILLLDTFNKLGYKAKINTHTTSCIN